MSKEFSRTELLLGEEKLEQLSQKKVAIFGIGGVGGYVAEALVRTGIGHFLLVDYDTVSVTNLNRQIIALHSTIGRYKVDVMKERMEDINPSVDVEVRRSFYLPENAEEFSFSDIDYIVDCIDTVTAKLELICRGKKEGIPVISSMGAGNKLSGQGFVLGDVFETSVCPLAKVMRRELKKRGVDSLKVVSSKEVPIKPKESKEDSGKRVTPGSIAYVPSVAGLILAEGVIKDLIFGERI